MQLNDHGLYVPDRAVRMRALDNWQHLSKTLMHDSRIDDALRAKMLPPISGGSPAGITNKWNELLYCNRVSFTAKASFTTEIAINDTAAEAEASLPARYFSTTDVYPRALRVVARGILSSTATPSYTFTLRLGAAASITAVIGLGSAALVTASGISNKGWEFEGDIIVRTLGTTGATATGNGAGLVASPAGLASPFSYELWGGAAQPGTFATLDPTIENFFNFNVTCTASSASNTITLLQLIIYGLS